MGNSWAKPLVELRRVSIHPELLATCGAVLGEPSIRALLARQERGSRAGILGMLSPAAPTGPWPGLCAASAPGNV